jgi:hypothetical protein
MIYIGEFKLKKKVVKRDKKQLDFNEFKSKGMHIFWLESLIFDLGRRSIDLHGYTTSKHETVVSTLYPGLCFGVSEAFYNPKHDEPQTFPYLHTAVCTSKVGIVLEFTE